jgi:hypothetical protein
MIALIQSDWPTVLKTFGPLGLGCLLAIGLVKALLDYIRRQHEAHAKALQDAKIEQVAALEKVVDDARKERDYSRQLREMEVNKFIDSLRFRDEKMERGFDEVVRALQDVKSK